MMCFRDKTFCGSNCINSNCSRHFGEDEQEASVLWWEGMTGEPPIAVSDFSSGCEDYQSPFAGEK